MQARSVRFRPSRFAREASTPPSTLPYARRQTAHGSLVSTLLLDFSYSAISTIHTALLQYSPMYADEHTSILSNGQFLLQGLYPEDGNEDYGHGSMYASTRPILAPTRPEARPVFTREVSAERGVRLPGGSRLQGVARVSIYLSEDAAYDAKPETEVQPGAHPTMLYHALSASRQIATRYRVTFHLLEQWQKLSWGIACTR